MTDIEEARSYAPDQVVRPGALLQEYLEHLGISAR